MTHLISLARARLSPSVLCLVAGLVAIQASWILVVPPFRGSDEHDHAYKAAAVARGDFGTTHRAVRGEWGEVVHVPADIVAAAGPVCESLRYTSDGNCGPMAQLGNGQVEVTSSAARYNPLFYAVIGTAARPFSGGTALYAMRITGAVACTLVLGLAIHLRRRSSRGSWGLACLVLALSPVMLYSTAVAAPNGLEMAAGALTWVALLGLRSRRDLLDSHAFVVGATVGGVLLGFLRTLGPVWLVLIIAIAMLGTPRAHLRELAHRRDLRIGALLVALSSVFGVLWSIGAGTNAPTGSGSVSGSALPGLPLQMVLWFLQSVAAFPLRNQPAPPTVYVIVLLAWSILFAAGLRTAKRGQRMMMAATIALALVVPMAITISSYQQLGNAWQGRYGYPFSMGVIIVCGFALDGRAARAARAAEQRWWLPASVGVVVIVSELVSQLHVLATEGVSSPLAGTSEWVQPSSLLVGLLTIAGGVLVGLSLRLRDTTTLQGNQVATASISR
ncbi:DUF2142 domain-containing protein [Nocardioides sp. LS1]|uniref:DUF2142 domain-containing protein n=1 Tax=Nocardioides sp. LS1 TaxID=1027620 RepID=UPI000F622F9F|nr:DUF2142 domain-containing protein [Nocardioides sp. LS1]GCD91782.1 hypothetical protein NLS1_37880 [Nocardioides sp. LS1]